MNMPNILTHDIRHRAKGVISLPLIIIVFCTLIIGSMYISILHTSRGQDIANPFGLIKMPAIYVDIVDDSIDKGMNLSLPQDDIVFIMPPPPKPQR